MTIRRKFTPLALTILTLAAAAPLTAQRSFRAGEKPFSAISRIFLPSEARDSLVEMARDQVGTRYIWGAETPGTGFDCSGLVQWLLGNFQVDLPRTSRDQSRIGLAVARDSAEMMPGDLLFFGKGRTVSHVGIYIGGGRFVHASNSRRGVIESALPKSSSGWWKGVRRLFTNEAEVPRDLAKLLESPVLIPASTGA